MTVGRSVATGAVVKAAPIALAVIDYENDGALSYAAFKTTVGYMKDKIKEGANPEEIERTLETAGYIIDVSKTFQKGAQNLYVEQRMLQKDGIDAIQTGKRAAVEFQLLPNNLMSLAAKQAVRTAIADDLFKGDRNAADKYLANSLIDDVIKGAQVIPLKDNQVNRNDVKMAFIEIVNNPDKHQITSKFFGEQDRLMNGLRQTWPELSTPGVRVEAGTKAQSNKESKLSDAFSLAADGEGSLMKIFIYFIAKLMQALGVGKSDAPDNEVKKPMSTLTPNPN